MITSLTRIVIVGGGVGGIALATKLGKKLGSCKKAEIILVDHNRIHLWKPLLHEIATGLLNEDTGIISYLEHACNHHFQFQLGNLIDINREDKTILLSEIKNKKNEIIIPKRKLSYDILVIAIGSITNDFDIPGVKENCVFLDNFYQARRFHQEMLDLFLKYSINTTISNKINITVVGGGATGVELSAEIHNAIKQLNSYGYEKFNQNTLSITLIEAGENILPTMPSRVSSIIYNKLVNLGIQILTRTVVNKVDTEGIHTKNGYIPSNLIIWSAGIKVPDCMKNMGGLQTNQINQFIVKPTLQTTYDENIFVIGDCASCIYQKNKFVPPRAQAAYQMANHVFYNILSKIQGEKLKYYIYKDYGSLISLSSYDIVGSFMGNFTRRGIIIDGRIARLCYFFLYRWHQVIIHGFFKTFLIILSDNINQVIRPRLKLY